MGLSDYLKLKWHTRAFSERDIRDYQWRELNALIRYAAQKAPYYASILPKEGLTSWDAYRALPIMDKTTLMTRFDGINTEGLKRDDIERYAVEKERNKDYLGYYQDRFVVGLSSGTSGNKGLFLTDKALTQRLPFVFLARSGLRLRDLPFRILFCLRVFSQGFADINAPGVSLHYVATMTPIEEVKREIHERRINVLMAPPSFVRLLLVHASSFKGQLKTIVCYAEVLTKEDKARFESQFGCRIIEIYQASEGQIASACAHGTLHINEDLVVAELVDDQGLPVTQPGIPGQLIITNLVNRVQPLIRYRMNDWLVLKDGCPCGSHFRAIDHVIGRQDDVMVFTNHLGQLRPVFPDLMSRWIITFDARIREFKVIQAAIGELRVLIDTQPHVVEDRFLGQLKRDLLKHLAEYDLSAKINLELVTLTYPADNGKFKRFEVNTAMKETSDVGKRD
jgi:putative adenylate-forming enzyme